MLKPVKMVMVMMTLAGAKTVMKLVKHVLEHPTLIALHVTKITAKPSSLLPIINVSQSVEITSGKTSLTD